MRLRLKLRDDLSQELTIPVQKFQDSDYRTQAVSLEDSFLSIDVVDFPVFWEEFVAPRGHSHRVSPLLDELRHELTLKLADKAEKVDGLLPPSLKRSLVVLGVKVI